MRTKNNPGKFDCYANAKPDEPMFILLGRDPCAGFLVELWAVMREMMDEPLEKITEARQCADAMGIYVMDLGKKDKVIQAMTVCFEAFKRTLDSKAKAMIEELKKENEELNRQLRCVTDGKVMVK